ncbi:hypothetical protein [Haloplanus halophilus]|uniref:hypothetical protein n=1 Tax=Haloplanus halophilus TaxID=2949993 RepID=UPI00204219F7|nr:hypothetical protein [Haloplanus sp. GDY1]
MRDRTSATLRGVFAALRRPDGRAAFLLGLVGYPPLYLASVGHLALGARGHSVRVVADPLSRALRPTRPFSFEPVARVALEPVALLVSPLDVGVALVLAVLVGCNLAVGLVAWRSPAACGVEGSAGALAGVPALLTGATCCGPAVLFALGVGAAGALLPVLRYATPAAGLLLLGGLFLVAGRQD